MNLVASAPAMAMDKTKEHQALVKKCLTYLSSEGFLCWANNTGSIKSRSRYQKYGLIGSSDIIVISPPDGHFCAFEIKTGKAVQSKQQKKFEKAVKRVGGVYRVIRSIQDLEDWVNG